MPGFLQRLLDQTSEAWGQLQFPQRVLIGSLSVAVVVALILALFWLRQPDYVTLYSDLEQQDIVAVAKTLHESNIPRRIVGTSIEVPSTQRDEAWVIVSSANLPGGESGLVGFEIFDERALGMTDAEFQQKHQRALQGHLSRAIHKFKGIRSASVTIVPERRSLFLDEHQNAEAAVQIMLQKDGDRLFGEQQVYAVANMVAHSVPGLERENISISVDGQDVSEMIASEGIKGLTPAKDSLKYLDVQKKFERHYSSAIQGALNNALGYNSTQVIVHADLDFTEMEREAETFAPPVPDETEGIVRSEHEKRENYTGLPGGMPGGIPGVDSNVPGGPPLYPQARSGVQPSEYDSREFTRNYEMNHYVERTVGPNLGNYVRKLSAAVMVDSNKVLALTASSEEALLLKAEITGIVKTVLAKADIASPPDVQVSLIPFTQTASTAEPELEWERLAELALLAIIVLSVVFLLRSMLIQKEPSGSQQSRAMPEYIPGGMPADIEERVAELASRFRPEEKEEEPKEEESEEEREKREQVEKERLAREQAEKERLEQEQAEKEKLAKEEEQRRATLEAVGEYMREDPEGAARLLATWIIEDDQEQS